MKLFLVYTSLFLLIFSCSKDNTKQVIEPNPQNELLKGADVSFLSEIEDSGYVYYNANNQAQDALTILKNKNLTFR